MTVPTLVPVPFSACSTWIKQTLPTYCSMAIVWPGWTRDPISPPRSRPKRFLGLAAFSIPQIGERLAEISVRLPADYDSRHNIGAGEAAVRNVLTIPPPIS